MTTATTHRPIGHEYETIYILKPDVDADTAERLQQRVAEVVTRENGQLVKVESWGRRRLAYPVAKMKKGVYMYVKYVGKGGLVQELERNLKLADAVMKFQTVSLKEGIDLGKVEIDPEEVKLQKIELTPEEDEKESREKALGLLVEFSHEPKAESAYEDEEAAASVATPAAAAEPKKEDLN